MPRELRVHGVSGTPPRAILYTDPITLTPAEEPTKIYQRPEVDSDFDTVAFHWANLTSGSRLTALWILLSPYALANAAGWMAGWRRQASGALAGGPSWQMKTGQTAVRAAGLAITALFLIETVTAVVVLPLAWLEQEGRIDWGPISISFGWLGSRPAATLLILAVGALFYWLVAYVSTRSHFDEVDRVGAYDLLFAPSGEAMRLTREDESPDRPFAGREDPAGATITDARLWTVHPIMHRLRRLHLGFGLLTLGTIVFVVTAGVPIAAALAGLLVTSLLGSWATTHRAEESWVWALNSWAPTLGLVGFLTSIGLIWTAPVDTWRVDIVHSMTFGIAAVLGVFVALALFSGPLSAGALVIATFFGAVLGTTVGLLIDKALHTDVLIDKGVGWVAVAMLAMIVTLAVVAIGVSLMGHEEEEKGATAPLPETFGDKLLVLVRRVALGARMLFYAAGLFGLASFGYVMVTVWSHGRGLVGDGAGFWETLLSGMEPAALDQFPIWLINLGVTIGLLGPGYFAVRSVVRGWRGGPKGEERRRQVGILWDLGSFWPRWFHPLAPPGYGPRAVKDLRKQLAGSDGDLILAAHSQGSLISAVTIALTKRPTRLITYGSQLGILYPRMFPATGIPRMVEEVALLCPIWVNLWRRTDYIGGQHIGAPGVDDREVTESSGHSGYELTEAYRDARRAVATER